MQVLVDKPKHRFEQLLLVGLGNRESLVRNLAAERVTMEQILNVVLSEGNLHDTLTFGIVIALAVETSRGKTVNVVTLNLGGGVRKSNLRPLDLFNLRNVARDDTTKKRLEGFTLNVADDSPLLRENGDMENHGI